MVLKRGYGEVIMSSHARKIDIDFGISLVL